MQEQLDKLYDEYLEKTLALVFDNTGEITREQKIKLKPKYKRVIKQGTVFPEGENFEDKDGKLLCKEWFDKVFDFEDGIAKVKKKGEYNLIDTNGNILCSVWSSSIDPFIEGCAYIKGWHENTFIKKDGSFVTREPLRFLSSFSEGLAVVNKKGKEFFIDKDGNHVFEGKYPHQKLMSFINGYSRIYLPDKPKEVAWNYINHDGKLISRKGFSVAEDFRDGCAMVGVDYGVDYNGYKEYYLIDGSGNKVTDKVYVDYQPFPGGYIVKELNGGTYAIDNEGDYYSRIPSVSITYKNGLLIAKTRDYIREEDAILGKGGLFTEHEDFDYDHVKRIEGTDCFVIEHKNTIFKSIVNSEGSTLSKNEYTNVYGYSDGYILAGIDHHFCEYVGLDGKILCGRSFDRATPFTHGIATVEYNNGYGIIDNKGNYLVKWQVYKPKLEFISSNFASIDGRINCLDTDMGQYKVKRGIGGYICSNDEDKFSIKYKPIRQYGSLVLCYDKKNIYLYHRKSDRYETLGEIKDIEYDSNFIFDQKNRIAYLVYNDQLYDITNYYDKYIRDRKTISVHPGINIKTKNDFYSIHEEDIRKKAIEQKQETERKNKEQKQKESLLKLQEVRDEALKKEEHLEGQRDEGIELIMKGIAKLEDYEKRTGEIKRIIVNNFFIDRDGYKEINPVYLEMGLKHIDLSGMPFKNVKVSGLDFRNTNILLTSEDPWEVYNHDLSNCNFEGISFPTGTKFDGVHIEGSKFTKNITGKTMGITEDAFTGAIYDDNTTLDGKPLKEIISKSVHK